MSESEKTTRFNEIAQKYGDPWIWGIYFTLIIISIIESYSASSREIATAGVYAPIIKQCAFLAVGGLLVFVLHRVDYNKPRFLYIMIPLLAFFTVFCLVYVMLFGEVINGAQRAMKILPGVTLQPAELAKLSIVTLLAYILAKSQQNKDISRILMLGLFYAVIGGMFFLIKHNNDKKAEVLAQSDTEMVAGADTGEKKILMRDATWRNRINDYLNQDSLRFRPITNKNQQEMFSRMAQAHGGLVGVGVGNSRECSRLPLAFSDYIYSIIIEETGVLGGMFVLILYLWLLARAAMIVRRSKRVLPSLLVIGMASLITYQALFHMAINVGVFPVSGQPLPLISKGGTSIVVMSVAFGVMLSVSRTIANYNNPNKKVDDMPLPEGLDAENPTQIIKNVWK